MKRLVLTSVYKMLISIGDVFEFLMISCEKGAARIKDGMR